MNYLFTIYGILVTLLIIQCHVIASQRAINHAYCDNKSKNEEMISNNYNFETPHYNYLSEINKMPDNCQPVKIWLAIRHGTRYPGINYALDAVQFLPYLRNLVTPNKYLCKKDYELLKNWTIQNDTDRIPCSLSTPQGFDDLKELAKHYMKMYPDLFVSNYSSNTYNFAHSSALRTMQSCEAFAESLFGSKAAMLKSKLDWTSDNLMLMPWQKCPEFIVYLNTILTPDSQYTQFMSTKHFNRMRRRVSRRLGYKKALANTAISIIWDECKFRQDYHLHKLSPWCAAFDIDDSKVLDYQGDLDFYYTLSYGNANLNEKLPCVAIKDMISHMTNDSSTNKVTAYFTHAELLTLMITAFGAYKDAEPLLADNFNKMVNHRKFRSSKLTPFASNIATVKYKCSARNKFEQDSTKILMLLNQKPIEMPWCKDGSVCTIDELQNYFNNSTMRDCPYGICGTQFPETSVDSAIDQDC